MLLPMMGLLFSLAVLAPIAGLILLVVPRWRRFAGYAFFVPLFASVGAFALAWGLVALGNALDSNAVAGYGFFGGFALGGLLGCALGALLGHRVAHRSLA